MPVAATAVHRPDRYPTLSIVSSGYMRQSMNSPQPGDVAIIQVATSRFRIGIVLPTHAGHTVTIGMQPRCYPAEKLIVSAYDASAVYNVEALRSALLAEIRR